MANKVPQLRKGLTRADLLQDTWFEKLLSETHNPEIYKPNETELAALQACLPLLNALIVLVESDQRVSQKTITDFFTMVERFCGIRSVINHRLKSGDLAPTILDRLVEKV
jgi:hypothetical protein